MAGRKRRPGGGALKKGSSKTVGQLTSHISNKLVRSEQYQKLRAQKKKEKAAQLDRRRKEEEQAEELGLELPPKKKQKSKAFQAQTIDNTREKDGTVPEPGDEELAADFAEDEFSGFFNNTVVPKVLLTTCYKPTKLMFDLLADMLDMLPNAEYYKRQGYPLKKVAEYAAARDFTAVLVFNEDRKRINGLAVLHLPAGPCAQFKLSSLKLSRDILGHARASNHKPELILNGFSTRVGLRVGRLLAALFTQRPGFRGRQVATFHNQRDFLFFRHHRYIFEEKEGQAQAEQAEAQQAGQVPVKARLQEIGPRFTLKLRSLQAGLPDASKPAEYEWVKNASQKGSRRKFHL